MTHIRLQLDRSETESIGVVFCQKLLGADTNRKQTSYNGNMRGNYAGIGHTHMVANVAYSGCWFYRTSLSVSNLTLLGLLVLILLHGIHHLEMHLVDDQIAAGSYYDWDESDTADIVILKQ